MRQAERKGRTRKFDILQGLREPQLLPEGVPIVSEQVAEVERQPF